MYRFIITVISPIVKLLFRLKTSYETPLPESGAVVLCGKHISAVDPAFAMVSYKRDIHYMAKASLFNNKLLAWFFTKMKTIPVNRGSADKRLYKTALSVLEEGEVLGIFPEGTRVHDADDIHLKNGAVNLAVKSGATIIPFGLYTKDYRVKLFRRVYLRFGKPISLEGVTPDAPKEVLQEITDTILKPEILRLSQESYKIGEENNG